MDWIRSVVDYLGPGQIIVGIVLLFVAPYATRWVEKTNEITVGVLFDSRMGLARLLRDALSGVARVVVNASAGVDGLSTAQLRGIYDGSYRDWSQLRGGAPLPIRIVGRGQSSGSRALFEQRVLGTVEPGLTSTECLTSDKAPNAAVIRCERDRNEDVVRMVSHTEGAIAYSDTASIAEARRGNAVTALTVDAKAFDRNSPAQVAYPFWTVEYVYSRRPPTGLPASFLAYVQRNDSAQARLNEHGYVPCRTPAGAPLELCNYR